MFTFRAGDHAAVHRFFHGMYVELQVRHDPKGQLSYVLGIPDRGVTPWAIALDPDHRQRLSEGARAAGLVATYVQCAGPKTIDLNEFATDVEHDWSGRFARASDALAAGKLDEAEAIASELVADSADRLPIAHHLLGRCHRARNRLAEAIACYRLAAGMAHRKRDRAFLPSAAGMLSDMGVAYKRSGDYARAAFCLTCSLSLRPNHPEALATFVTLFGESDALLVHACARIAALGRDKRADQLIGGYSAEYKKDAAKLLEIARWTARDLDLARWPLAVSKEELVTERFLASLDAASGEPRAPALEMPPPPPAPPPLPKAEPPRSEPVAAPQTAPLPVPVAAPAPAASAAPPMPAPAPEPAAEARPKKPWWKFW